jgi:hypothetical protein
MDERAARVYSLRSASAAFTCAAREPIGRLIAIASANAAIATTAIASSGLLASVAMPIPCAAASHTPAPVMIPSGIPPAQSVEGQFPIATGVVAPRPM